MLNILDNYIRFHESVLVQLCTNVSVHGTALNVSTSIIGTVTSVRIFISATAFNILAYFVIFFMAF